MIHQYIVQAASVLRRSFWPLTSFHGFRFAGLTLLVVIGVSPVLAGSKSARIVTFNLTNYGKRERDVAATFGSVFVRGDVRAGAGVEAVDTQGNRVPLQVDRKAMHRDHSLRHAVITVVVPQFQAGSTVPVTLRRANSTRETAVPITSADLPSDFDVVVTLTSNNRRLTTSARRLLAAAPHDTWLSGPLVSEWWVAGAPIDARGARDSHLRVAFGIRCYGKNRPLRIEVDVDNSWTFVHHPMTESYDVEITARGKTVFQKSGIVQPAHTRWRTGFWWDEPASVYVRQDLGYLKRARVVPNYDPDLRVPAMAVDDWARRFAASDRGPMGAGLLTKYMPTTGGRADIGPLPQWQALYLLTMDPQMYEITLQTADLGAGFSSHYRNEKTGRPLSLEDDPNISTHSNYLGRPGQPEIPDTGEHPDALIPDAAHEPALDFVPYLITGDRFYLEELEFWSQWNAMGTAPAYHGLGQGLVVWDQVRAQAWSLRTLAQAEYIVPDSDPMKLALRHELTANIRWYTDHYLHGPDSNRIGLLWPRNLESPYNGGRSIAPWQDDFFTWALGYVEDLGDADVFPLLQWKARFALGRISGPGFCWVLAPAYTLVVRDSERGAVYDSFNEIYEESLRDRFKGKLDRSLLEVPCGGQEVAQALSAGVHEMVENPSGADGYSAFLQPALATAADWKIPGAAKAWETFASRSNKPDYSSEPAWDIVPRSD